MIYAHYPQLVTCRHWHISPDAEPQRTLRKLHEAKLITDALSELAQWAIRDRDDLVKELLTSFRREKDLKLELDAERESKRELVATIQAQQTENEFRLARVKDLEAQKHNLETSIAEKDAEIEALRNLLAAKTDSTPPTPVPAQVAAGEAVIKREWNDDHTLAVVRAYAKFTPSSELMDSAGLILKDLLQPEPTKRSNEWMRMQMEVNRHGGSGGLPPGKFGLTGKAQEAKVSLGQ